MNTKQIKERLEHVAKAYVPHSELAADALAYIAQLERQLAAPLSAELTDEQIAEIYTRTFEGMDGCARRAPKPFPLVYVFARALLAQRAAPTAQPDVQAKGGARQADSGERQASFDICQGEGAVCQSDAAPTAQGSGKQELQIDILYGEAQRYRKGMDNWKATAEAKDRLFAPMIEALKYYAAGNHIQHDSMGVATEPYIEPGHRAKEALERIVATAAPQEAPQLDESEIIGKFLDAFEDSELQLLRCEPRERAMQAHYSTTMGVMHNVRQFLKRRPLYAAPVSTISAKVPE